ncbi:variant erythrocyte surface antigen-1 family protein [Babesia divergens]|uniref:Variant erythrocyte surface antigen-1 family protein n=1 Tax=Babesia divergens TaxID=32595 RepID=A0AAD9GF97_BABDI|nr:variant erythrocyte surface antigen-1 family protein [Babesia divergens]
MANNSLLHCPKNLRECIDWVLCIHAQGKISDLASAVKNVLGNSNGNAIGLNELVKGLESFLEGIKSTRGSYVSSYLKTATWEKLCQDCKCRDYSKSKSLCPCSCGSSPVPNSVCNPDKCCPDCNVRAAARVFLCFLPCMWYALDYLYKQCNGGGWQNFKISDNSLTSLGSFFAGMGYDLGKLDGEKNGSQISSSLSSLLNDSGPLKKLYDVSQKYFPSPSLVSPSDSKSKPKTVRDILLWLSGLPFTSGFKALLLHCKGLCSDIKDSSNPVQFNNFESSLYASCLRSPFVLAAIEDHKEAFKNFPPYKSEISKFSYPSDHFDLFEALFKYIHKIYTPLTFLEYQCKTPNSSSGWKNCGYGQKCMDALGKPSNPSSPCCPSSLPKGILCTGQPGETDHAEHCTKVGVECMALGTCNPKGAHTGPDKCTPCPHPLVRFLTDSWPFSQNSPDPSVPKMGFDSSNLPSPGRRGEALHIALKDFCDSGNSSSSLATLLKFELHVSRHPPETLGELFGFFKKFVPQLTSTFKTFETYIKEEPGFYSADPLKDALQKLYGSHSKGDHKTSTPAYDLRSLSECHVPQGAAAEVTCGPYLNSLTGDVYTNFIDNFDETYLSWICYLPKDFQDRLEKLKKDFASSCSDCYTPGSSPSSSCSSIIYCPCSWPLISSQGFSFTSRGSLSGETKGKKKRQCSDFIKQLEKVLQDPQSTLLSLIAEIENFIWSIRFPFFLFVLAFWAFVISYFLYVQLYKLDLLHLKSHAHFSRSFKILPSTLFSDASSKLKDLSYFSL